MTLRTRLFVSVVGVTVPLAIALFYLDERVRLRDMGQTLQQVVDAKITSGAIRECSDPLGPRSFPPPGPPPGPGGRRGGPPPALGGGPPPDAGPSGGRPSEFFAYASDFQPVDRFAPPMPVDLRDELERASSASTTFSTPEGRGVAVGVRVPGTDSACAYLLARMRPMPGVLRNEAVALGLVVLSVLVAAWVAAGPVITRMRRLADDVRTSAASHYEQPVTTRGSATDELSDLARAFNAAGSTVRAHLLEIQAREDTLRRYVADTTHDIALPLTVLQGHLADLERSVAPDAADRQHVREAIQEAHYMASLLRNLGATAKLDEAAATAERGPVDLSALVDRVVTRHRTVARARQVGLEFAVPEQPLRANADLTLLEQAVSNLVENAVQYNRPGGHVAVVLDRHGSDRFTLTVTDDGPGVAEEELAELTTRRFRGSEARTRRPDGQGLGLAIVAQAAKRLDFTLTFRRPEEGGLAAAIEGPTLA